MFRRSRTSGRISYSLRVIKVKIGSSSRYVLVAVLIVVIAIVTGVRSMDDKYFKGDDAKLEPAILADDGPAIAEAIAHGANVNARGTHGVTPLMLAVDGLKRHAVAELLARGANPNLKAADDNSAVSLAVENYRHSPEIFLAVMKGGGDPNIRRPDNDPVIMRFLNDADCDYIRAMKSFGADLDINTRAGEPIIIDAALGAEWDVVWCLIELGAKYDYESTARIPLSVSIADDFPAPDSPIYPYKKKVSNFLREHGLNVTELK